MRIDIIIVNYLSASDVGLCLRTLGPWAQGSIWLVNNSANVPDSSQDSALLVQIAEEHGSVELIEAGENGGFARGCNLAYGRSDADIVVLLNPDACIGGPQLLALARALDKDPRLAALSPIMSLDRHKGFLIPPTVAQTPASALGLALSTRWAWLSRWLSDRALQRMQHLVRQEDVQYVDFLSGAVLAVRRVAARDAAETSGLPPGCLFDPEYFMFFEDSDLSHRLTHTGWRLGVHPGLCAVHAYSHKPYKAALMEASRRLYFRKRFRWFYHLTRQLRGLDRLMVAPDPVQRFGDHLGRLSSAAQLLERTGGAPVLALSPSLLTRPALFRPPEHPPTPLTKDEWDLLEPGPYCVLLAPEGRRARWAYLERAAAAPSA